jgi:hypothetical protein
VSPGQTCVPVITIYTKGDTRTANHSWIPLAENIGTPSKVGVQIYTHFTGSTYSSNTCKELDCSTFLHVPRTHIIFSLASFTAITTSTIGVSSRTINAATLCDGSAQLFLMLQLKRQEIGLAVSMLTTLFKRKPSFSETDSLRDMSVDSTHERTQDATWAAMINGHHEPQEDESDSEYGDFDVVEEADK